MGLEVLWQARPAPIEGGVLFCCDLCRMKFLTIFCAGESGRVFWQHAGQLHRDTQLSAHHAAVNGHREVLAEGHRERPGLSELLVLQRTLQHRARKCNALPPGHRRGEYYRSYERIQVDILVVVYWLNLYHYFRLLHIVTSVLRIGRVIDNVPC